MCNEFGLTVRRQLVEDHSNVRLSRPRQNPESERQARERLQGGGTMRLRVSSAADSHDNAAPDGVCRCARCVLFPAICFAARHVRAPQSDVQTDHTALVVARSPSGSRAQLLLLPPGGMQSLESAFSMLFALQIMRSELQVR